MSRTTADAYHDRYFHISIKQINHIPRSPRPVLTPTCLSETAQKMDKNAKNALLEIIATALQNLLVVLVTTALVMVHDKPARQGPLVRQKEKKTKPPVKNVLLGRTIKFQDEHPVIADVHQERLTLNEIRMDSWVIDTEGIKMAPERKQDVALDGQDVVSF